MRPTPEPGRSLPIRATAIVLGLWTAALVLVALVGVPLLFAVCGGALGSPP